MLNVGENLIKESGRVPNINCMPSKFFDVIITVIFLGIYGLEQKPEAEVISYPVQPQLKIIILGPALLLQLGNLQGEWLKLGKLNVVKWQRVKLNPMIGASRSIQAVLMAARSCSKRRSNS